jgi:hypothetical protein
MSTIDWIIFGFCWGFPLVLHVLVWYMGLKRKG